MPGATTDMACDAPLMAQDQWVGSFIGGATVALAGNTLTLGNGGVTMNLTDREAADPDRPLVGTRWIVDGFVSGDAVSSVPMGVVASVQIAADGTMAVDAGCNVGSAPVTVEATTFTVGPMALTKKACEAGHAAVEAAVTTVLQGSVRYTIEADVLTLTNGPAGLTLRAIA
jgi:heat shock protein HslJ